MLKPLKKIRPDACAFIVFPAEFAGWGVSLCRAEAR